MSLVEVPLDIPLKPLPARIKELLDDADERIERFVYEHRDSPIVAFVPCDFVLIYQAYEAIVERGLTAGSRFAEWGSGIGAATCLASLAGFDAIGIEIEDDLIQVSRDLAETHEIEAEFVSGSFVPPDGDVWLAEQHGVTWLRSDGADAYDWLDLEPDDFDLVFSYPWPGEESIVFNLFNEYAATGALLLTYHGQDGVRLQRRKGRR